MGFAAPPSHVLHDRWTRFVESRAAPAVLFAWAVAEATVWPIVPDFLLAPMMLVRRTRRRWLVAACVAGMTIGGLVTVLVAHWAPDFALDLLRDLPLVTTEQVTGAAQGIDDHGAAGFLIQPVSGIPFKAWATMAGVKDVGPALVIPAFVVARATRMIATAFLGGVLGHVLRRWLRDWFVVVAGTYVTAFALAFVSVVL